VNHRILATQKPYLLPLPQVADHGIMLLPLSSPCCLSLIPVLVSPVPCWFLTSGIRDTDPGCVLVDLSPCPWFPIESVRWIAW
jgi:hypothetical protein